MTSYTVIYNPTAGHQKAGTAAKKLAGWLQDLDCSVILKPTKKPEDAAEFAYQAQTEVVVAMGGDGTINQVASGLVKRQNPPTLGIIPQGTVNNLAKVLHIPLTLPAAANVLYKSQPRPLDIGLVNGRAMVSTMTLGVLANAALSVSQSDKQRFGPLIFLFKGAKSLLAHQHWHLILTSPHHIWEKDTQFLLVTMTNSVGGFTNFAPQAKPDDGKFHVFIAPKQSIWHSLFALPYFISGNFAKLPGMTYFTANSLRVEVKNSRLQSRIDGDPSAKVPLKMQVISDKVKVLAP